MAHLLVYKEWQSPTGYWYCNDVSDLAGISGQWWVPARMLEMSPCDYLKWLIENYKPDKIHFDGKNVFYSWSKEHYMLCHKFLLDINREARKRNFIV